MLVIENYNQIGELQTQLRKSSVVYLDIETNSLDPYLSDILSIQIKMVDKTFIIFPYKLDRKIITYILELINSSEVLAVGHNIKFDIEHLATHYNELLLNVHDTMVMEMVIYAGIVDKYPSLQELAWKYSDTYVEKEVREQFQDMKPEDEFTSEQIDYIIGDVEVLEPIYHKQMDQVDIRKLKTIYDIEYKLTPVVASMELEGVLLDKDRWSESTLAFEEKRDILKEEILDKVCEHMPDNFENVWQSVEFYNLVTKSKRTKKLRTALEPITDIDYISEFVRENFNVKSTYQLQVALGTMGINVNSTAKGVLNKLNFPITKTIMEFREYEKLVDSFGYKFINSIHPTTGRIHTNYNQAGAVTGRFSSSHPVFKINLQQIPRESNLRHSFIARPGYKIITEDYDQMEMRSVGAVTGEPAIIEAYRNGIDLHKLAGANLFGVSIDEVTKDQRYFGKTFNFAVVYGITEWGLSRNLDLEIGYAKSLLENYFAGFPILALYIKLAGDRILENLYSVTPFGRKRYFELPLYYTDDLERTKLESKIKREGFNFIIQGGCADVVKMALNEIFYTNPFGEDFKIIMQVHDEIVAEAKEDIAEDASKFMLDVMVKNLQPLLGDSIEAKVDYHIEDYWTK